MKYYKDTNGNVFAYELDGSQDNLIGNKIRMTDEEVQAHLNSPIPVTPEQPIKVTPRQFRLALTQAGIRNAVENYVKTASQDVKDYYEFSLEIVEDHPIIIEASVKLGLSNDQRRAIFGLAKTL